MTKKYPALEIVSGLSVFFGWLIFVLGGLFALFSIFASGASGFGFFGIPILIGCIFVGLFLIASGELIKVVIDIEANTRGNLTKPLAQPQKQSNEEKKDGLRIYSNGNWDCPICHSENLAPIGECKFCNKYIVAKK